MKAENLLKNMFELSSKIAVYIPSTMNIDQQINNSAYVKQCAILLSDCFGGATSTEALGYWRSPEKGLVTEKTTMIFAYCTTEQASQHLEKVYEFCLQLKNELKQDAIAMEYNNKMYFVD